VARRSKSTFLWIGLVHGGPAPCDFCTPPLQQNPAVAAENCIKLPYFCVRPGTWRNLNSAEQALVACCCLCRKIRVNTYRASRNRSWRLETAMWIYVNAPTTKTHKQKITKTLL
jgi:hypothetical protein